MFQFIGIMSPHVLIGQIHLNVNTYNIIFLLLNPNLFLEDICLHNFSSLFI